MPATGLYNSLEFERVLLSCKISFILCTFISFHNRKNRIKWGSFLSVSLGTGRDAGREIDVNLGGLLGGLLRCLSLKSRNEKSLSSSGLSESSAHEDDTSQKG